VVDFLLANLAVGSSKAGIEVLDLVHPGAAHLLMLEEGKPLLAALSFQRADKDKTYNTYNDLELKFTPEEIPHTVFRHLDCFFNVNMHEFLVLEGVTRDGKTCLEKLTQRLVTCDLYGGLRQQSPADFDLKKAPKLEYVRQFERYEATRRTGLEATRTGALALTSADAGQMAARATKPAIDTSANNEKMERYVHYLAESGKGGAMAELWSAVMKRISNGFVHTQDSSALVVAAENLGEHLRFHSHVDSNWSGTSAEVLESRRNANKWEVMAAILVLAHTHTRTHTHTHTHLTHTLSTSTAYLSPHHSVFYSVCMSPL
jgi:hypothetical protein